MSEVKIDKGYKVLVVSDEDYRRIQKAVDYYESVLARNRENQRTKRGTTNAKSIVSKPKPDIKIVETLSLTDLMSGLRITTPDTTQIA